jgi:hypothetical protein
MAGIVYKPIICRVLTKLTILIIRFGSLTTFNRPDTTVLVEGLHLLSTASAKEIQGLENHFLPCSPNLF